MQIALRCVLSMAALLTVLPALCRAQDGEKFHFLAVPSNEQGNFRDESFVVALDRAQKAAVDELKAQGKLAQFSCRIAAGAVDYNRDYYRRDRPVWNWHVVAVEEVRAMGPFADVLDPRTDSNPSDIAANPEEWIRKHGDRYTPRYYRIGAQFDPASTERFHYMMGPRSVPRSGAAIFYDTFVVEVDQVTHARIQELLWMGHQVGVRGEIAAGAVWYNKNYYKPAEPAWKWHFTKITGLRDFTIFAYDTMEVNPNRDSSPSTLNADPEQWIRSYGTSYYPKDWAIHRQLAPGEKVLMANVSNRGMTGAGEKALITGLIIKGGEPRNVVVRALGPTMAGAGVQQIVTNPRIEVFSGSTLLGANSDWKTHARAATLAQTYPALAPADDKEAALLLTLMPGTYTLHGTNEDGSEGVMLLEAYDVDSSHE